MNTFQSQIILIFILAIRLTVSTAQSKPELKTDCYFHSSGFCGKDIYLNSDSTFTQLMTCESSMTFTTGDFYFIGDSIVLKSKNLEEFNLISIEKTTVQSSNFKQLRIIDKYNNPVSYFEIRMLKDSADIIIEDDFTDHESADTTGKIVIPTNIKYLELIPLSLFYKRKYVIPVKATGIETIIKLNFNCSYLMGYDINYEAFDYPVKMGIINWFLISGDEVFQPCE